MDAKQRQFSVWYLVFAFWGLLLVQSFLARMTQPVELPYSEFKKAVADGQVAEVSISTAVIHGRMKPTEPPAEATPATPVAGTAFDTVPVEDPDLLRDLAAQGILLVGPPGTGRTLFLARGESMIYMYPYG